MNKELSISDLVGDNEKKFVKLSKHLSERNLLRESDI
jgi:hypothetical protein